MQEAALLQPCSSDQFSPLASQCNVREDIMKKTHFLSGFIHILAKAIHYKYISMDMPIAIYVEGSCLSMLIKLRDCQMILVGRQ